MDYDSSTKFISSLAKFLQSLCNGYVEFDNGVQVIGHLYLSVDTGKTIDYVLNEKVCKSDENSVTFISNSFHAQPAEKPKPPEKKSDRETNRQNYKPEEVNNGNQMEPRSTNIGTVPGARQFSSIAHPGSKRPHSPSKQSQSGYSSPKSKKGRSNNTDTFNSSQPEPEGMNDLNSADPVHQQSSNVAGVSNEAYQQNFLTGYEDSATDDQEQRDIKPSFDTDVTFIKEEYAPPSSLPPEGQEEDSQGDNSSAYSSSYSNQPIPPGGFASYQRSNFNPSGFDRSMYGSGTSKSEGGDMAGDPSDSGQQSYWEFQSQFRIQCHHCDNTYSNKIGLRRHLNAVMGAQLFGCDICGKRFSRNDVYKRHLRAVHGEPFFKTKPAKKQP